MISNCPTDNPGIQTDRHPLQSSEYRDANMDSSFFNDSFFIYIGLAVGLAVFYWTMRALSKEPGDSWDKAAKSY